ncbi:DUF5134 domain-containing protein [Desertihabitans aurantiacus]|uniref:DUF5134 domain-containing protein n=1 Tax=Desertihabitans aurantiacus TaxID=2282477 RepID=UPI000DF76692|nr:DUF5134 domain-containing protein [Desertihabitans aurantiacus]
MVEDVGLRVVLSVLFGVTAVWFVLHGVRGGSWADRVCDGCHAAMSLAMVGMAWPAGTGRFVVPQVLVFAAASLWFLLMAVLPSGRPTRHREHADGGPWLHWLHVAMMLAMVWMLLAMPHLHGGGSAPASWVLTGTVLLALLLAGTALSVRATVPLLRRTPGRRAPAWHLAHVVMGAGMAAMVAPVLLI